MKARLPLVTLCQYQKRKQLGSTSTSAQLGNERREKDWTDSTRSAGEMFTSRSEKYYGDPKRPWWPSYLRCVGVGSLGLGPVHYCGRARGCGRGGIPAPRHYERVHGEPGEFCFDCRADCVFLEEANTPCEAFGMALLLISLSLDPSFGTWSSVLSSLGAGPGALVYVSKVLPTSGFFSFCQFGERASVASPFAFILQLTPSRLKSTAENDSFPQRSWPGKNSC